MEQTPVTGNDPTVISGTVRLYERWEGARGRGGVTRRQKRRSKSPPSRRVKYSGGPNNLDSLRRARKAEGDVHDPLGDLTYNVIILCLVILLGGGAAPAVVAAAATCGSDSFSMSSHRSFHSSSAATLLSLASFSAVASSASSFRRVSSEDCSFCSCIILDGPCRVADELGVGGGQVVGGFFEK